MNAKIWSKLIKCRNLSILTNTLFMKKKVFKTNDKELNNCYLCYTTMCKHLKMLLKVLYTWQCFYRLTDINPTAKIYAKVLVQLEMLHFRDAQGNLI